MLIANTSDNFSHVVTRSEEGVQGIQFNIHCVSETFHLYTLCNFVKS